MFLNLSFEGRIYMSQTGTPTEFLKLGITEPDDTLNVLVDLNGQWQKIDTGVKNVDTKANTNASGISALNTAVQDNTENITNILETNVNQQNSIDTLQSKVATLEQDDTDYGTRITAVEAGVQENSELINDLEVDLSGVKTSVGTVPEGSNLQGEVNGLDTRVTALENSGSVAAVEARVTTLETEVGTVPAGETVQGQISDLDTDVTALQGQVNSGNIPFRFSVDGGGNYGYLKADDSFVPFSSSSGQLQVLNTTLFDNPKFSYIALYKDHSDSSSIYYKKVHDLIRGVDYTTVSDVQVNSIVGNVIYNTSNSYSVITANGLTTFTGNVVGIKFDSYTLTTKYLLKNGNSFEYKCIDFDGNAVGQTVNFSVNGITSNTLSILTDDDIFVYKYNDTLHTLQLNTQTGQTTDQTVTLYNFSLPLFICGTDTLHQHKLTMFNDSSNITIHALNYIVFNPSTDYFYTKLDGETYYTLPN